MVGGGKRGGMEWMNVEEKGEDRRVEDNVTGDWADDLVAPRLVISGRGFQSILGAAGHT